MIIPGRDEFTAARVQALTMTVGLFTFVAVGIAGCLALIVGLFWIVINFVLLVSRSIAEAFSGIAAIWTGADSLLKLIILVGLAYGGYCFYQSRMKKRGATPCFSGLSS
jgi:hypothetical protein